MTTSHALEAKYEAQDQEAKETPTKTNLETVSYTHLTLPTTKRV